MALSVTTISPVASADSLPNVWDAVHFVGFVTDPNDVQPLVEQLDNAWDGDAQIQVVINGVQPRFESIPLDGHRPVVVAMFGLILLAAFNATDDIASFVATVREYAALLRGAVQP